MIQMTKLSLLDIQRNEVDESRRRNTKDTGDKALSSGHSEK
jgi:hypothetical protein